MNTKFGLYSKVNETPYYMTDALSPADVIRDVKIVSNCKLFDRYKKTIN